jgi:hypothetical protein
MEKAARPLLFGCLRVSAGRRAGILDVIRDAGEHVLGVERARTTSPNRIIDNATIAAYNSDSKHRITKDAPHV